MDEDAFNRSFDNFLNSIPEETIGILILLLISFLVLKFVIKHLAQIIFWGIVLVIYLWSVRQQPSDLSVHINQQVKDAFPSYSRPF